MKRIGIPSISAPAVRRLSVWALACFALLWASVVSAGASDRVALVVGNAAYEHTDALRNPGNDAEAMAAALERLGFEVVLGTDLDLDGFYDKLDEFDAASRGADVTLFFYAGHGLQVDGKNWLAPVDARLGSKLDLKRGAVELDTVLDQMRGTTKLVYLDACRTNPLARGLARSMGLTRTAAAERGLARVEDEPGTLIGYATAPGGVADDGGGLNSPFTEALLAHIEMPGLSVNDMFGEVSKAVRRATGGDQVPWISSSLGRFHLALGASPPPPDDAAKLPQGAPGSAPGGAAIAPPADGGAAGIILPDGLTLADWALLAEDRLEAGDHARLLEEATAHLREHGPVRFVEAVRERAVSGLVEAMRVSAPEDAPEALERIARLEAAAGPRPELLRLRARAHGLLGDHAAAAAHLEWLRSVPQAHPDRRAVLSAPALVRTALEASRRFSELVGRPFSPERKEVSVGWTDLHHAALLDLPGAVAALCGAGMDPDARLASGTPFGNSLKRTLAALGHSSVGGWDAAGETPLMIASRADAREAAAALADCGADVNATDDHGDTPLHGAAWRNAVEAMELLIERGADVEATNDGGQTPLHYAAWKNAVEAMEWLAERGADVNATDGSGWTPLHRAAWRNAVEAMEWLAERGADVNATTDNGHTPLYLAAHGNAVQAMEWLAERGADLEATDGSGWTPLHRAAWRNAVEAMELLIERGADLEATDDGGQTPLHLAAHGNAVQAMEWLAERGADLEATNDRGQTPLHLAAWTNAVEAMEWLAERGADPEATNDRGQTPLHRAAQGNAVQAMEWFAERGADVNATDGFGQTPLHLAAHGNAVEAMEWLAERGTDLEATDGFGLTPLDRALSEGHREAQEVLRRHGGRCATQC